MSESFTVYLRNEEKVLLMQRADGVSDFPGAWDGIYGLGNPEGNGNRNGYSIYFDICKRINH